MTGFRDRVEAGQQLAQELIRFSGGTEVIVLALPRGGVPVAYEVAKVLDADLDILVVRKLGYPGQEEFAMGAIAGGGVRVMNATVSVPTETVDRVAEQELKELHRREESYRGDRPYPNLEGRTVLLVDDGIATGSTMRAAVSAVRQRQPGYLVVAVPVASDTAVEELRREADEVVCLMVPDHFMAVGQFYDEFSQTTDDDVRDLLQQAWSRKHQDS